MKKFLAVFIAAFFVSSTALAALTPYTGSGTLDPKMKVSFKLGAAKVRAFKATRILHDCTEREDYRDYFTLPPVEIKPDRTFRFSASQDFGEVTGTVLVRGRVRRDRKVVGVLKQTLVYEDGDVCKTGRQPFRAHRKR